MPAPPSCRACWQRAGRAVPVGAFAAALLYPVTMPLQRLVAQFDQQLLPGMQDWVRDHWGDRIWTALFVPILARPCWLMPLAGSLVLAGVALTMLNARRVPGSSHLKN